MGVLGNLDHERFCQAYHKRIWAGEKHVQAAHAAYRETIWEGEGEPLDIAIAANVRRLRNRKEVKARIAELAEYAGKIAGLDSGWAMLKLKTALDEVEAFNLDDYLEPRTGESQPDYDLSKVTREQLGRLSELAIEPTKFGRKVKIAGPKKPDATATLLGLMARIAGWEAPKKIAPTNPEGTESFKGSPHVLSDEELLAIALGARANQAA